MLAAENDPYGPLPPGWGKRIFFFFFGLFAFSRAASMAYRDSQARGLIGDVATA